MCINLNPVARIQIDRIIVLHVCVHLSVSGIALESNTLKIPE